MLNYDIGNFQPKFTGEFTRLQQQRKECKKMRITNSCPAEYYA